MSQPTVDVRRLRAVARMVLTSMKKLREAGLDGKLKDTIVAHAIDLAIGSDERLATNVTARGQADVRALAEAGKLQAALARVDGQVAANLLVALDAALQGRL